MQLATLEQTEQPSTCLSVGEYPYWSTSLTGIIIDPNIPREKWAELSSQVAFMFEATGIKHSQSAMMLGDLLNFGEDKFGEEYASIIDGTRKFMQASESSIKNWRWISRKIEPARRNINLFLGHHEAVASLPPKLQDEMLHIAEAENMSIIDLRKHMVSEGIKKIKEVYGGIEDSQSKVLDYIDKIVKYLNEDSEKPDDILVKLNLLSDLIVEKATQL
jgi:hypothetical protein